MTRRDNRKQKPADNAFAVPGVEVEYFDCHGCKARKPPYERRMIAEHGYCHVCAKKILGPHYEEKP